MIKMMYFELNGNEIDETMRRESQAHGFIWEEEILRKIYNVDPEHYNSIHDLLAENNKLEGVNVSIKTSVNQHINYFPISTFTCTAKCIIPIICSFFNK